MALALRERCLYALGTLFVFFMSAAVASNDACPDPLRHQDSLTLVIDTMADDYASTLKKTHFIPAILKKVTFSSDVFFELAEFLYLTDLHEGTQITTSCLDKAVGYLIKKNKFSKITLHITPVDGGIELHLELIGFWAFARLKIHGFFIGKDTYKRHYAMEPGDPFDDVRHQDSIARIKEDLKKQGFFNASVVSSFKRDQATKTIYVHITIERGPSFSTAVLPTELRAYQDVSPEELDSVRAHVERFFVKRLSGASYAKKTINKVALAMRQYLVQQGFTHTTITLREQVKKADRCVQLSFLLDLHGQKKIIFLGNSFFTSSYLLDYVVGLGPASWLLPTTMLQEELLKLYWEKGFRSATVDVRNESKALFFIINERARACVSDVVLEGLSFYEPTLFIKRHFKEILKHKYCDEKLVQGALNALVDTYRSDGFSDVCVQACAWSDPDYHNRCRLLVNVKEGERSYLASVKIPGYEHLENAGPCAAVTNAKEPIPFSPASIREQRTWLLEQLRLQGLIKAHVTHEIRRAGTMVSLVWLVNAQLQSSMRFGKTVVIGSSGFPFEVLQREFACKQGGLWDHKAIKKTLMRIKDLDAFERVYVYPYNAVVPEETKAVVVKVHKDDPFEVRLRPGIALQQLSKKICFDGLTYKLGGSFIVKNPLNVADQFRVEADVTRSQRVVEVSYRRPWLFSLPLKTVFKIYNNRYEQPGCIGLEKNIYCVTQQGFLMGLTKRHDRCDAAINLGYEYMETVVQNRNNEQGRLARSIAHAINFEPNLLGRKIPYIVVEPSLVINRVDNSAFARKGLFTVISLKGMFPMGNNPSDIYFIRFLAEQSVYIPIKAVVLALRCRIGHIFHQDFSGIMPTERFYLGGANSIRSYETDLCPPLGQVEDCGKKKLVPQGGKSLANLNIEARFPLYGRLGGVFFQDIGGLSKTTISQIKEEKLLAASGFGLRYKTPLGPLRFDFGVKWHAKVPHESRYAWFLTFGHAF